MDKRQKIFLDAEKIVKYIDSYIRHHDIFPDYDDIMLHFRWSDRMFQPRNDLAWAIHKKNAKKVKTWEEAKQRKIQMHEEAWRKEVAKERESAKQKALVTSSWIGLETDVKNL